MKKAVVSYSVLTFVVILLVIVSLFVGSVDVFETDSVSSYIIFHLRLPRVLMSVFCGAGLAVCGCCYQAIFRNPLSDPYILGVSSGASLGASIAIVLGLESFFLGISSAAFLFAILTVLIIIRLASSGSAIHTTTLLLAGVSINFLFSALISVIMLLNAESLNKIYFWTMGSMANAHLTSLYYIIPVVATAIIIIFFYSKDLNALLLGQDTAKGLGVDVERVKKILLFVSTIMVGVIVSECGVIGFVGLIVPHGVRLLAGSDNRKIIPLSVFGGAIFMLLADLLARTLIAPSEIPVGAITSLVGSPLFIYLLYNAKRRLY